MDLTKTSFPERSFAAIASLSVVEHGVDLDAYLAEAARILRPGGLLFTSTDYWCEPIDTTAQTAYGHEVRIHTPADFCREIAGAAMQPDDHGHWQPPPSCIPTFVIRDFNKIDFSLLGPLRYPAK